MFSIKTALLKFLEFCLYLHGILHFVEVGVAIYEEAYITASIAAFGAIVMTLSAIFLGDHHNHTGGNHND
tara:strand:- start:6089 stop:6298 length:210 start_codon:yes stop_codon:yes gene_type:complete